MTWVRRGVSGNVGSLAILSAGTASTADTVHAATVNAAIADSVACAALGCAVAVK